MTATRLTTWILGAAIGLSGVAYAQEGPPPGNKPRDEQRRDRPDGRREDRPPRDGRRPGFEGGQPGARLDQLRENIQGLDLTADQKESANKIIDKAKSDLDALRADGDKGEPRDRMHRGGEVLRQMRDDLQKLLTAEQQKQVREKMGPPPGDDRRGLGPGERGPGGPGGPEQRERMEQALNSLNLPPEQLEKVKAVFNETREKMEALHEKQMTTREEMREVMENQREQLSQLLSREQHEQLREKLGPGPREGGPRDGERREGRGDRPERHDRRPPPKDQI